MEHGDGDLSAARQSLYALLARLYLRPPDLAVLATLRSIPDIADTAPETTDALEHLQVEYEAIFGRNAYPYESLYVDHDLMLNTAAAQRFAQLCHQCGFVEETTVGAPDHLGRQLGLMAHLLAIEIRALREQNPALLRWSRAQQHRCLVEHLAHWTPVFLGVVERVADHPLYCTIARVTLELILDDLEQSDGLPPWIPLSEHRVASDLSPTAGRDEDDGALFAHAGDDNERDLNQIVRSLIIPDVAGMFISRRDIGALGCRLGIKAPLRERMQMMRDLFDAAARFERIPALLDHLDELFAAEFWRLAVVTERYPVWTAHARHWLSRLERSRAMIRELRTQFLAYHAQEIE
ncbi:molecular chaperone [Roseiflexus sp.]|uniref:TorD/DmsD family molecular chaperone n=1 Tax=Roseiflexus sp. TaxID=2562120 RepID=UPI0021DBF60E|nr:molecular chaperone TorD family protein [Roseiflexus sp.]GIW01191.1 MAG: dehydrogenase [Roseiflexus sp.]